MTFPTLDSDEFFNFLLLSFRFQIVFHLDIISFVKLFGGSDSKLFANE